jgi:hypothetical protein
LYDGVYGGCGPYGYGSYFGYGSGYSSGYGSGYGCGPYGGYGSCGPRMLSVTQPVLAASITCNPTGCATVTQPALQTCTLAGCFTQPIGPPNLASVGAYCSL